VQGVAGGDSEGEGAGDEGNILERMKEWKANADKREKQETRAWEQAIIALQDTIEHSEDQEADDVQMQEAEEALKQGLEDTQDGGTDGDGTENQEEDEEEEMSSYEKERLANIKRNNAFLFNLGIDKVQPTVTPKARPAPKSRRRERSPPTPGSALPTRRSTRAASGDAQIKAKMMELESLEEQMAAFNEAGEAGGKTDEDDLMLEQIQQQCQELKEEIARLQEESAAKRAKIEQDSSSARARVGSREEEEEESMAELHYDDSSVKRYECKAVRLRVKQGDLTRGVQGLAAIQGADYTDTNLKRIYSISFRPCGKLVAAAGHGGMAGVFGIGKGGGGKTSDEDEEVREGEEVLLSWKAHQVCNWLPRDLDRLDGVV
jgi:hypothetical protein